MTGRAFSRRLVGTVSYASLVPGRPVRLRHPPYHVLVVLLGDEVFAIEDACNHGGASLSKGPVLDDCIACPLHGYVFSLRTGELAVRPRKLCDDQRRFEVERDGDDVRVFEPDALVILGG